MVSLDFVLGLPAQVIGGDDGTVAGMLQFDGSIGAWRFGHSIRANIVSAAPQSPEAQRGFAGA
jgi:hypothetical protein